MGEHALMIFSITDCLRVSVLHSPDIIHHSPPIVSRPNLRRLASSSLVSSSVKLSAPSNIVMSSSNTSLGNGGKTNRSSPDTNWAYPATVNPDGTGPASVVTTVAGRWFLGARRGGSLVPMALNRGLTAFFGERAFFGVRAFFGEAAFFGVCIFGARRGGNLCGVPGLSASV